MCLVKWANSRIKGLDMWDMGLTKLAVFAFALMVTSLVPSILNLDWY